MSAPKQQIGLRERKKAKLRERILRTSIELFETKGYHQTRVADIVEALEISQPTFFRYFPSKDDVLREVFSYTIKQYREALNSTDTSQQSVQKTVDRALRILAAWARQNRSLTIALAESRAGRSGQGDTQLPGSRAALFSVKALRSWQEKGQLRQDVPAEVLAQVLGASVMQALYDWCCQDDPGYELDARFRQIVDCFMRGADPLEATPPA